MRGTSAVTTDACRAAFAAAPTMSYWPRSVARQVLEYAAAEGTRLAQARGWDDLGSEAAKRLVRPRRRKGEKPLEAAPVTFSQLLEYGVEEAIDTDRAGFGRALATPASLDTELRSLGRREAALVAAILQHPVLPASVRDGAGNGLRLFDTAARVVRGLVDGQPPVAEGSIVRLLRYRLILGVEPVSDVTDTAVFDLARRYYGARDGESWSREWSHLYWEVLALEVVSAIQSGDLGPLKNLEAERREQAIATLTDTTASPHQMVKWFLWLLTDLRATATARSGQDEAGVAELYLAAVHRRLPALAVLSKAGVERFIGGFRPPPKPRDSPLSWKNTSAVAASAASAAMPGSLPSETAVEEWLLPIRGLVGCFLSQARESASFSSTQLQLLDVELQHLLTVAEWVQRRGERPTKISRKTRTYLKREKKLNIKLSADRLATVGQITRNDVYQRRFRYSRRLLAFLVLFRVTPTRATYRRLQKRLFASDLLESQEKVDAAFASAGIHAPHAMARILDLWPTVERLAALVATERQTLESDEES